MIRKYLIVSRQLFFSTIKVEEEQGNVFNVDLLMPLEFYWATQNQLKKADYLLASKGELADIQAIYKRVCQRAAAYAVFENDRALLLKKFGPPRFKG